jgi:hypothetical protein
MPYQSLWSFVGVRHILEGCPLQQVTLMHLLLTHLNLLYQWEKFLVASVLKRSYLDHNLYGEEVNCTVIIYQYPMYSVIRDNYRNDKNILMWKSHFFSIFRSKNYGSCHWTKNLVMVRTCFSYFLFPLLESSLKRFLSKIMLILGKVVTNWLGSSLFCLGKKSLFRN